MRVVITGGNRGIGLEFTKRYLDQGHEVDATTRSSHAASLIELSKKYGNRLHVRTCDVASESSVRMLSGALGDTPVDLLINNAGVMGKLTSLDEIDCGDVLKTFETNTLGPLRVTSALLPNLRLGTAKKVVHISSGMGSIGDNGSGGAYGYRISKAGLNMACRSMAVDLKHEKIIVVVMNPGWVQTDMGGQGAPTTIDESVTKMMTMIDSLSLEQSGQFLDYRGHVWPW